MYKKYRKAKKKKSELEFLEKIQIISHFPPSNKYKPFADAVPKQLLLVAAFSNSSRRVATIKQIAEVGYNCLRLNWCNPYQKH